MAKQAGKFTSTGNQNKLCFCPPQIFALMLKSGTIKCKVVLIIQLMHPAVVSRYTLLRDPPLPRFDAQVMTCQCKAQKQ